MRSYGSAEEEVRLDHLEALVRERRRVDRDLRAHRPGRMRERLLGRDVGELVARAAAERAAARGQDDALRLAELRALEERRVLAVDRDQLAPAPLLRRERELAGGDEALLVRERERDAVLERPHRRREPGEADDGVQDDVGLGALEQLGRVAADLRQRREPVDRRRARRGGDELELGMRVDHLDRLAADRAGRAEQGDPLHPGQGSGGRHDLTVSDTSQRSRRDQQLRDRPPHRRRPAVSDVAEGEDAEVRRRRREEERVDAVEHAAVAAEQRAGVLHPRRASAATRRGRRAAPRPRSRRRARATARSRGSAACRARRTRRRRSRPCRRRSPPTSSRARRVGAILWRPSSRPPKYANVSPAHTASRTVNAASRPCAGRSRRSSSEGEPARRSRRRPAPSPRSTPSPPAAPPRSPFSRNASASASSAPPSIQPRPPICAPTSASIAADVAGRRERPERPRDQPELVQRDQPPRRAISANSHQPPR